MAVRAAPGVEELARLSGLTITPSISAEHQGCPFRQASLFPALRDKATRWRGGDQRRKDFTTYCKLLAAMELNPVDRPGPCLPLQGAPVGALPLPLRRAPPCIQRADVWRSQAHATPIWLLPSRKICFAWFLVLCFPRVVSLAFSLLVKILARAVVIFASEGLH